MYAACPWSLLCYQIVPDIFCQRNFNLNPNVFLLPNGSMMNFTSPFSIRNKEREIIFQSFFWSLFLLHIGSCQNTGPHGIIQVHQMMIISRLLHCLGRPQDMYLNSVIAKQLETTTFLFTPCSVRWKLTTNKKPWEKMDMKSNPNNEI